MIKKNFNNWSHLCFDMHEWCEEFVSEMNIFNPSTSNVYKGIQRYAKKCVTMNFLRFNIALGNKKVLACKKN